LTWRRWGDHIDRFYRAARGLCGSREEAEDLVPETLARVLRKPRVLRSDDDLGYLRGCCATRSSASVGRPRGCRRRRRCPTISDLVEDKAAIRPDARIESTQLYAVISALPEDFRDPPVAIDVVGLSYREAARPSLPELMYTGQASPRPPARR
jgi:RNA polymerase sigma-70 factor (ECF subfamily)